MTGLSTTSLTGAAIGVVADDFTGATDVAVAFRRSGLSVTVYFGQPAEDSAGPGTDVAVVALKTRTVDAAQAVAETVQAARWLQGHGARQLFFKYCSTFDSTVEGNIGPVADALGDLTGAPVAVVVPASPAHGRTQYCGHLFVGDVLLSDSPMRHHPLTPMRDARVAHLLAPQTVRPVSVVTLPTVAQGAQAVRDALQRAATAGSRYAVVDALDEEHLQSIGEAVLDAPLVTGAAGLAGGLGRALAARSTGSDVLAADEDPLGDVSTAVLAGSCSAMTLRQLTAVASEQPLHQLDALSGSSAQELAEQALQWYDAQAPGSAPVVAASLPAEQLHRVQEALGIERSAHLLESALGRIAQGLVARGVRRLIVAGGETSGSVVTALGLRGGTIGAEEATGVPWIHSSVAGHQLAVLLKSGNFGDEDLLRRAARKGRVAR